jgi:hypothetical protein
MRVVTDTITVRGVTLEKIVRPPELHDTVAR